MSYGESVIGIYDEENHMMKFNEAKTIGRHMIQDKSKKDVMWEGIYLSWYDYIIPIIIFSSLYGS